MEPENKQVLPKVIWEEVHRYPHVRQCTVPLLALAVQCTTSWDCYGTLHDAEPLRKISSLPIT